MVSRSHVLVPALALMAAGCASAPAARPNPYTADQVVRLLLGAVSPDRILYDAARECISFTVSAEVRALFAEAGAPASFADSLQSVCQRAPVSR
jgi:hypothetical protein